MNFFVQFHQFKRLKRVVDSDSDDEANKMVKQYLRFNLIH